MFCFFVFFVCDTRKKKVERERERVTNMARVEVNKRPQVIPPEYISTLKPGCDSWEQLLKVQPQITAFTSTSVPYKTVVDLPNYNFRLDQVYIEADVTVTFSSDNGGDTYSSVQPAIVPWASSLINEVRLFAGSTMVSDIRQCK